jgi:hypothetical protein
MKYKQIEVLINYIVSKSSESDAFIYTAIVHAVTLDSEGKSKLSCVRIFNNFEFYSFDQMMDSVEYSVARYYGSSCEITDITETYLPAAHCLQTFL